MFFNFNGGILAVAVTILDRRGIYNPSRSLCKDLYDEYLSEKLLYNQVVEHNISTILNSLLFRDFQKGALFYTRWRVLDRDNNLVARRFFYEMFNDYQFILTGDPYEPKQYIETTRHLYTLIQTFLRETYNLAADFEVFAGLVYESDIDYTEEINQYLHTINFVDVIETTKTASQLRAHRIKVRKYRSKLRNRGTPRLPTSDQVKGYTRRQKGTDRVSRSVTKRDLKISTLLYDLDKDVLKILEKWKSDLSIVHEDRIEDLCIITRKNIIDLVMKDMNIDLTQNRPKKWQSIIKASYEDLRSYELLQELDQYLQEL